MAEKRRKKRHFKLVAPNTKPARPLKARLMHTLIAYAVFFLLLTGFLFVIQVILGPKLQRSALGQWTRTTLIAADRGEILDRSGKVLATNGNVYKVVVWPKNIPESDRERTATELSKLLGMDYDTVLKRCSSTKYQEIVLKRQIDSATRDAVNALKLGSGVGTAADSKRYYPMGSLFSQMLGFTNVDNVGQAGLELSLNEYLAGKDGKRIAETDSSGNLLAYGQTELIDPVNGLQVRLTCDSIIEGYLENALKEALEANNAKRAMGIVMDCTNGAILALSSQPDYDPNDPPRSDLELLAELSRNRIVTDVYEPGSTFKIITLAAALDSGAVTMNSHFSCSGGSIVNGETIHCWKHAGHGDQDLTNAAENSCNCAFLKMALSMGKETFYDYIYAFGLGKSTGSGLIGEASGIVTHQKYITDNDLARIGFGQSIAVTPIQLAAAVCAAVNGGELYQPYIVDSMLDDEGNVIFKAETAPVRRVISEESSALVRKVLQSVVDNGTGRNCRIEGYKVGGKTGTAQKYDAYGRVDQGKYICSFIGFAPADNPRFVCLIIVDEPDVDQIFGSTVAAPFVKNVLEDVLHYMNVRPTEASDTVDVPKLIGLTTEEAAAKLEELGLYAVCQSEGTVLAQVPAEGERVPKGFQVLLYTGENTGDTSEYGKEYVEMPDLKGYTPLQAYDALKRLGLIMISDDEDPSGWAYIQSVDPGVTVEKGTTIKVNFSFYVPDN